MRELKMAIGGTSDRSGNNQNILNQLFAADNVIFSDEGSGDSFALEGPDEHEIEEKIWQQAKTDPRPSI